MSDCGMSMPRRMQTLPRLGRQRGAANRHTVTRVAVIVGAAGDQQTEILGHPAIAVGGRRVVIRVIRLERIETGVAKCGNTRVDERASGMSERGQAAGPM